MENIIRNIKKELYDTFELPLKALLFGGIFLIIFGIYGYITDHKGTNAEKSDREQINELLGFGAEAKKK